MMRRALPIAAALALGGCETLVSDAATRLRYEFRDAAERLEASRDSTVVLTIAPRSWPDGCSPSGRYRVRIVPYRGGKQVPAADVFVRCLGGREYATGTRLAVSREMSVEKSGSEPLRVTLRKTAAGIEIHAID